MDVRGSWVVVLLCSVCDGFTTAFKRDSHLLHSSNTYRTLCFAITLCFSCFFRFQFSFTLHMYISFFFFVLFLFVFVCLASVPFLHAGSGGFFSLRGGDERRPREKR